MAHLRTTPVTQSEIDFCNHVRMKLTDIDPDAKWEAVRGFAMRAYHRDKTTHRCVMDWVRLHPQTLKRINATPEERAEI
jgi:hypothetical protein